MTGLTEAKPRTLDYFIVWRVRSGGGDLWFSAGGSTAWNVAQEGGRSFVRTTSGYIIRPNLSSDLNP